MSRARRSVRCACALVLLPLTGCALAPPGAPLSGEAARASFACTLPTQCVDSLGGEPAPLRFGGTPAAALAALRATLASFPEATLVRSDASGLEATFTTPAGFVDRVEFRIDASAGRIDYRSRSSFGLYDFGKNRSRMKEFAARFEARPR